MFTVSAAQPMIVAEWRAWAKQRGSYTETEMFLFFGWLQKNKSHLLSFRCREDKWQRVHGWLERDEAVQARLRAALGS